MTNNAPARRREITASVTSRGQVTIPAEVRRLLGLGERDKVTFVVENGEVSIRKPKWTVESAGGSVTPINQPEDFDELIRIAQEDHAEEVVRKMRQE